MRREWKGVQPTENIAEKKRIYLTSNEKLNKVILRKQQTMY